MRIASIVLLVFLSACGGGSGNRDGGVDAGDDAAVPQDLAVNLDFATSGDLAVVKAPDGGFVFGDGGAAERACERCLSAECTAPTAACYDDPSCQETFTCAVESGCLVHDADGGVTACFESCVAAEHLTAAQAKQVAKELDAIYTCAPTCASKCGT